MSELASNDPDEDEERPALLGRIRPIAEVFFGGYAVAMILSIAHDFWLAISSQI
jgi:hypothetical protein